MVIYRPKCRAGKPDDAAHLHREMQSPAFRYAAGGLAGALIASSASLTYAATLNQNLRIAGGSPLGLVADIWTGPVGPQRAREVQVAQAGKTLPGIKSSEPPETAAEIVGRMLAPGASNPDVPLPHPDLSEKFSEKTDAESPLKGSTPCGRGEAGGGVMGFRVPLPGNRGSSSGTTTSSSGALPAESSTAGDARPR
jgi:hypothetical protein